ncbi:GNAT family N-acetyltransferase [Halochromatium glycolicum]|uniref:N-acetyltransferase domain-containing protein n=1 Tax=Halochromatium glycolicum TaxID=85075 RepID=A0AAJ0U8S6_9GAMM|nr:GNAT family protein [Halochromatium glycolicum]MBK1707444.1 hypothetical protein [Halochromatium glycolicum]
MDVTIQPFRESDAPKLYAAVRESIAEVQPWMPWCHDQYSEADAISWIELASRGRAEKTMFEFAIFSAEALIGACGINHINLNDRVANLGYWVRSSRTGRGAATEAVKQLISWGFDNTEFNRIEIVAAVENVPSQRVAEKVGAVREGILRMRTMTGNGPSDAVMYSVVRPDLEESK